MWFWEGQKTTAHLKTATSGCVGKTSWRCSELPSLWFPNRSDGNLKAALTTRPSRRPNGTAGQLHASPTEKWGAKRSSVGDGPGLRVWVSTWSYSARSGISSRLFVCFSLSLTFELASQVLVSLEPLRGGGPKKLGSRLTQQSETRRGRVGWNYPHSIFSCVIHIRRVTDGRLKDFMGCVFENLCRSEIVQWAAVV